MEFFKFIADVIKKFITVLDNHNIPFLEISFWEILLVFMFLGLVLNFIIRLLLPVPVNKSSGDIIDKGGRR